MTKNAQPAFDTVLSQAKQDGAPVRLTLTTGEVIECFVIGCGPDRISVDTLDGQDTILLGKEFIATVTRQSQALEGER